MDFKGKVIELIKSVPYGKVTTYGTLSTLAGNVRAARIVGGILHYSSDKEDLPWYRVVNRNGFISTICFDHPKSFQKGLLESEGIEVSDDFVIDLDKYGWFGS